MTIRELAELIDVSPATVSIVINGKRGIREETRQRVLEAVERYHYVPAPRNLSKKQNVLLIKYKKSGSLIEENQGFISMIIDSIEEELRRSQYTVTTGVTKENVNEILTVCETANFCGMILIASEITNDMYAQLKDIPMPFVLVDNTVPNYPYSSVCMNNYENVWLALKYCKQCGHERIGYLRSSADFENFRERNKAFNMYVKEVGLDFEEKNEFCLQPTLLGAYEGMKRTLREKPKLPTCFFADNDSIAFGAIKALKENGYKIPRDISVVGFDDIPYAAVSSPALTTIRVQREVIGRQAVFQLQKMVENSDFTPIKSRITGTLIIRESVRDMSEQER